MMIKKILLPFFILSLFLVQCKNEQTSVDEQERLKAIEKENTQEVKANNEYFIAPPDTDYTGDYMDRYPNGIIKFNGFFRFGKRHGQWMAFYENGIKWSECFYDKGNRHGASTVFYPNGKVHYKGWFKNDLRDSLWFFYDEEGKEVDRRAFKNDQETGLVNQQTFL